MFRSTKPTPKSSLGLGSISRIFLEHNVFLKKFLAKFLNREQDIEDIAQEAYLKAYSVEQERGEIEHPKAFLFSIAKNLAINELSRKSRTMTCYLEECQDTPALDSGVATDSEVEAWQTLGIYCEAVAALPEKCRVVYLLRKVHGLSHREIAERLGISRRAVEDHLSRGSLRCRNFIRQHQGNGGVEKDPAPAQLKQPSRRTDHGQH